jgi:hypothetical protein
MPDPFGAPDFITGSKAIVGHGLQSGRIFSCIASISIRPADNTNSQVPDGEMTVGAPLPQEAHRDIKANYGEIAAMSLWE